MTTPPPTPSTTFTTDARRWAIARFARSAQAVAAAVLVAAVTGCGSPSKPNIELRRQNAELRAQVEQLQRDRDAHAATIAALESRGTSTVTTLSSDRVGQLFTTHGLQFGRLTGGADLDPKTPGEEGIKVYVVPTDGSGQPIKMAGAFLVEAFDLAQGDSARIGRWEFPLEQATRNWFGQALLYGYVLQCPWQAPPRNAEVTLRVSFTDGLTQRQFTQQKVVKVTPPAAGAASTAPAPASHPAASPAASR
ncbi:MAG TPA: hypothetical protein VER17_05935 [Tepidisphaeraceae bacterium]|nr:hypothetical protein [Tepidisphaeraceae bacterium]